MSTFCSWKWVGCDDVTLLDTCFVQDHLLQMFNLFIEIIPRSCRWSCNHTTTPIISIQYIYDSLILLWRSSRVLSVPSSLFLLCTDLEWFILIRNRVRMQQNHSTTYKSSIRDSNLHVIQSLSQSRPILEWHEFSFHCRFSSFHCRLVCWQWHLGCYPTVTTPSFGVFMSDDSVGDWLMWSPVKWNGGMDLKNEEVM